MTQPIDPLQKDWEDLSTPDSWSVGHVYEESARELVARELRRIAARYAENAKDERRRYQRLADRSPRWQYESAIASYQELNGFVRALQRRADELHPAEAGEDR